MVKVEHVASYRLDTLSGRCFSLAVYGAEAYLISEAASPRLPSHFKLGADSTLTLNTLFQ